MMKNFVTKNFFKENSGTYSDKNFLAKIIS